MITPRGSVFGPFHFTDSRLIGGISHYYDVNITITPTICFRATWCRQQNFTDIRHPLHGHTRITSCLKSRRNFVTSTDPNNTLPATTRVLVLQEQLDSQDASVHEHSCRGTPPCWWGEHLHCIGVKRLSTQIGRPRTSSINYGYSNDPDL